MRDVLPRHVIMFYYCHDTTLDMGPTGIIPGSQYYAIDREGAPSSEHGLPMAPGEDLATRDASLDAAGGLLRGGVPGADGELFGQLKIQVPAGTLAIVHHGEGRPISTTLPCIVLPLAFRTCLTRGRAVPPDMFHRQCRHGPACVWRPMIKMGAVRLAEPPAAEAAGGGGNVAAAAAAAAAAASSTSSTLHDEVAGWLAGSLQALASPPPAAGAEVGRLAAVALDAASEVERYDAACALGQLARQQSGASEAAALAALRRLFCSEAERGRRAGLLGSSRAGLGAVGPLLEILADPAPIHGGGNGEGSDETTQTQAHVRVDAAHAIGQAVTTAVAVAAGKGHHGLLLPACARAVDGLAAAIARAAAELAQYAADHPEPGAGGDGLQRVSLDENGRPLKAEDDGIRLYPLERRRLMAEAACSLGLVGQAATAAAAAADGAGGAAAASATACRLCAKAVVALHPLVVMAVDPGARFKNFMVSVADSLSLAFSTTSCV